jgi:hypothetical protein
MGNGALPHGPSYRARPRLYRKSRADLVPASPVSGVQDLSAAVEKAAEEHKCLADAMREIKLPNYEKWANYDAYLPMNIERYCDFYSLGI